MADLLMKGKQTHGGQPSNEISKQTHWVSLDKPILSQETYDGDSNFEHPFNLQTEGFGSGKCYKIRIQAAMTTSHVSLIRFLAEMLAIHEGLCLAACLGISKIVVESNSLEGFSLIAGGGKSTTKRPLGLLILELWQDLCKIYPFSMTAKQMRSLMP
ncbi:uncharacterized protein LOC111023050 [Momordica charantia]|uniref:Uncharacterized protein LOC111023050 n=1 Tax=Momordica charantia TaxID=3673 RepID=A0A6J1DPM3_MOMCH|nr:uncharacterized protein LOC111023050 [Momordica charantia]